MHSCPACPKSFPSPYKLQRHYVIHTGQKPFTCTLCGTSFTQSGHLKTHLQKVHQPRPPATCGGDGIVTLLQQEEHHETFLGINARGSYNCSAMPSALSSSALSSSALSSSVAFPLEWKRDDVPHRTEHPPVNTPNEDASAVDARRGYTCELGSKSSTPSPRLWSRSPPRDKARACERSGVAGRSVSRGLRPPRESSSGGRKLTFSHRCPLCLKSFSSPSKLQRHALIHTGQKPYSCGICRKAFRQKVHLKSHLSSSNTCSPSARTERDPSGAAAGQRPRGNPSVELELQCKISLNAVQDLVQTEIKSEAVARPERSLAASGRCLRRMESGERERRDVTQESTRPVRSEIDNGALKSEGPLELRHEMHQDLNEGQNGHFHMSDSEDVGRLPDPRPAALNVTVKPETCSVDCSDFDEPLPRDWEGAAAAERREPFEPFEAFEAAGKRPRTHECRACFKCFPSASKLQRHTMTHTGQRPFGCEMCGKRFRQKTHLRVHCRTHLWSKYHRQRSLYINRPPSCRGGFTRRTAAEATDQETAPREDPGGDVASLGRLDQTPRAVIIPSYRRESEKLSPQISKQREVAPPVSTATVKRTPIANPMQNPSAAQHECSRCSKCFPSASKLQRHEMIHTGLKPFLCVLCGKTFRQATHLKSHERTHCEKSASEPGRQREDVRAESRWRPGVSVGIPQRDISVSGGGAASGSGGSGGHVVSAVLCTGPALPIARGNHLLQSQTKFKSNHLTCRKKKLYTCRICFQNFAFPYKLSRHLATHSGVRPHKCAACGKTFTQLGHLKVHEHRCRQVTGVSDVRGERINTDQEKCPDDPSGRADCRADATREQVESRYAGVGPSCPDGGASYLSEAMHPDWLAVSEVGVQEEDSDLGRELRDDYQAPCDYDQAADLSSYSFPSELSFEMDKLVQNQNVAAPLFSQFESVAHNAEEPRRPDVSDERLGGEPGAPPVDAPARRDDNWCEPLNAFECNVCSAALQSEIELQRHICSIDVRPKTTESARRNRCDVCFKHFVSPSKLKRHELIHTGLRPFRCDICGKTFTQSGHVRTHRLTH